MKKLLFALLVIIYAYIPLLAHAENCRIPDYPHEIECGTLKIQNVSTGKIDHIAWRRVEARARYPHADPVVWIPGGLGVEATDRGPAVINMLSRLNNSRDLIWIDILGSGASSPFQCAKPRRSNIKEKIDIFSNSQTLQNCHDEINNRGGFKQFGYSQLAQHYEQLRQQLNLKKVNVIADGAGGNIALAWHTLAPSVLRSMVLDSPLSLDENPTTQRSNAYSRVLSDINHACQIDMDCQKYHPQSAGYLKKILDQLPQVTTLTNPHSGLKEQLKITEDILAQLLMGILRSPARAAALPNGLHAASEGNWQPLIGLSALSWAKLNTKFSNGLWLASLCENGWAHPDIQLEGDAQWFYNMQKKRFNSLCNAKFSNNQRYTLPLSSAILIFSPLADPFVAADWKNQSNLKLIRVPGATSGVLSLGCARDIAYRFISNPDIKTNDADETCLTDFPLPVVGPVNRFGRVQ